MSIPRKLLRHVHAWRHRPEAIAPPTLRSLKAVKKVLDENFGDGDWHLQHAERLPEPLRDPFPAAVALLASLDEAGLRAATFPTLVAAEALAVSLGTSVLEAVCVVRTPEEAVRIAWEAQALFLQSEFRYTFHPYNDHGPDDTWRPLRAMLAAAPEAAHSEAQACAAEWFASGGPPRRLQLMAYAFAGNGWAQQLLRDHPDEALMAADLSTLDTQQLTKAASDTDKPDRLPLLVTAAVGLDADDAIAWLDRVLRSTVDDGYWMDVPDTVTALSLFSPDAVEPVLAPHRDVPQVAKAIARTFG